MVAVSRSQSGSWPRNGPVASEMITAAARRRSSVASTLVSNTGTQRRISWCTLASWAEFMRWIVDRWAIRQARSSARRPGPRVSVSSRPHTRPAETCTWPSWKSPWVASLPGGIGARPWLMVSTSRFSFGSRAGSAVLTIRA